MVTAISMGYKKLNPEIFMYIPYDIPRKTCPVMTGRVKGKAALNAGKILFFYIFGHGALLFSKDIGTLYYRRFF